jgi:two-component system NtrC family sensor kinase
MMASVEQGGARRPLMEVQARHRDGHVVLLEVSTSLITAADGTPKGFVSIIRDITERQRMEDSLRLKEDAIEYSLGAIAMSDMEGKITYVNKACMRLWGSDNKEDIVGKPYWELLEFIEAVPEKAIKRMQEIKGTVTEDHLWNGELAGINKEGEKIYLYVTSSIVKDNDGNPIQTISSFYDVTERKQAEEEKQRMEQQLQLAGRLAAIGELAAGVAHELNNPLAAVQAFAQFLSERKDLDESTKSDVETIYKESQRATRITTNLLSFARKHKPEKGFISINEVVEKSLELHTYRIGVNNIEISMELDQELPRTMADFYQLEQVFVNIVTNAEQAMTEAHGGGKLLVKTRLVGELIQITFTDDGPGIPKDNLKSVFDPFFTTKEVGGGTGLGLSICYGIVHEHGGQIRAESEVCGGAAFIVELPIVYEDQSIEGQANHV